MNEAAGYWWEMVDYDLGTLRALVTTKRYLHVGFFCHLIIEKSLKALIAAGGTEPPRIHNLSRLAELGGVLGQMEPKQLDVLDALEPMHIEGRYPGDMGRLAEELDAARCAQLVAQTEELCEWIRAR